MVEVTKRWRRWCGPRSELVRATEHAAEVLGGWTGLNSAVRVRIEQRGGLTETATGVGALTAPHEQELAHVDSIVVDVEPDREERQQRTWAAIDSGTERPTFPDARVSIRITKYGTALSVEAEDRTGVEGLAQRLAEMLGRAATKSPGFDRDWLFVLGWVPVTVGLVLGAPVARWVGLAERNDKWDAAEIVGMISGALCGAALVARAEQTLRVRIARDELRRIRDLTQTINALEAEIADLVAQIAPQLLCEPGFGPLTAAKLVGEIAGAQRFSSDAKLARAAGVAPIPVSSAKTNRHRLDRGGNRQINATIHRIAVTRLRCHSETQNYIARKRAQGKSTKDAIRCLKRHLTRRIWHLLQPATPTPDRTLTPSIS